MVISSVILYILGFVGIFYLSSFIVEQEIVNRTLFNYVRSDGGEG